MTRVVYLNLTKGKGRAWGEAEPNWLRRGFQQLAVSERKEQYGNAICIRRTHTTIASKEQIPVQSRYDKI